MIHTKFDKFKKSLIEKANDENIKELIKKQKNELNYIDTTNVTDMSYLFFSSLLNGDISKWDVSNVIDMKYMFSGWSFKGDISSWNVNPNCIMYKMFYKNKKNKPFWYKTL